MVHGAVAGIQLGCLVEIEIHIQRILVIELFVIPETGISVAVLAAVAAEPYDFAVFQLLQGCFLEFVERQIEQFHTVAADDIAEVFDGIQFMERFVVCRTVDDADIFVEVGAEVFLVEFLRCDIVFGVRFVILVIVFECE